MTRRRRPTAAARSRLSAGLTLAVVSAVTFGLSGALARGLLDTGWSAGAITLVRVGLAAAALTPFGLVALRGRWHAAAPQPRPRRALRRRSRSPAPSSATSRPSSTCRSVRRSSSSTPRPRRSWSSCGCATASDPGRLTLAGAALAALGLVLVLDLVSGADLSVPGVLWALGAMVGLRHALHHQRRRRQRAAAAGAGLGRAARRRASRWALLGLVGLLPMRGSTDATSYAGVEVPWWVPLLTARAGHRRGRLRHRHRRRSRGSARGWRRSWPCSRCSPASAGPGCCSTSCPGAVQLLGGLLILAGVVAVKAGESSVTNREPAPA